MSSLKRILQLIGNYKWHVVGHVLSNVLMAIFTVLTIPATIPIFKIFLEKGDQPVPRPEGNFSVLNITDWVKYYLAETIENQGQEQSLIYICLLIVVLFFLKNLFQYLAMFFLAPVRTGIVRDLRIILYDKLLALSLSYYSEERKGDILSRASSDVQEVEWSILNVLEKVFKEPLIILGCLGFMLIVSVKLTFFVLILVLIMGGVIGVISARLKRQSDAVQRALGKLLSILDETLFGLKIIKGFNAQRVMSGHFDETNQLHRNLHKRLLWRRDLASPLSEFLGITVVTVLFWYGGKLVLKEEIDPSVFLSFLLAFYNIISPAKSFSKAYYNVQKGIAAMDRIEWILKAKESITDPAAPLIKEDLEDSVKYCDVYFKYRERQDYVLTNINLTIEKGQIVALVGASGAGKTTMADLLPRYYDVDSGSIQIDGIDIRKIKLQQLRRMIGIVTQEPILFNDTIRANIAFSKPSATDAEIEQAARVANAFDFINQMPEGFDTNVGDRGMNLSGGQRQRISIARAVLKDPPILILDEATSALDSESEKLVQDALQKVMRHRTAIVIAHRLSTVQNADKIVVMKDGKIIESGKHEDLMASAGEYRKFVELQVF